MDAETIIDKPRTLSSSFTERHASSKVVYLDPNRLVGESIIFGFQQIDPSSEYHWYSSAADWLPLEDDPTSLIIIRDLRSTRNPAHTDQEIASIKEKMPAATFVILADHDDCANIQAHLQNGARGFLSTDMSLAVSVQILHLIMAGGVYVPATTLMKIAGQRSTESSTQQSSLPTLLDLLTPKEILVAKKLCKGSPNKIIAYDLNMCESTVKVHVRTLMRKLGAKNRTQVAFISNEFFAHAD